MPRYSDKPVPFLGLSLAVDDYDDDRVTCAYLWRHYQQLMTALEKRRGDYLAPIVCDSEHEKVRKLYAFLEDRDGHVPDDETMAAFQTPIDDFRASVAHWLVAECASQIDFNSLLKESHDNWVASVSR